MTAVVRAVARVVEAQNGLKQQAAAEEEDGEGEGEKGVAAVLAGERGRGLGEGA